MFRVPQPIVAQWLCLGGFGAAMSQNHLTKSIGYLKRVKDVPHK